MFWRTRPMTNEAVATPVVELEIPPEDITVREQLRRLLDAVEEMRGYQMACRKSTIAHGVMTARWDSEAAVDLLVEEMKKGRGV